MYSWRTERMNEPMKHTYFNDLWHLPHEWSAHEKISFVVVIVIMNSISFHLSYCCLCSIQYKKRHNIHMYFVLWICISSCKDHTTCNNNNKCCCKVRILLNVLLFITLYLFSLISVHSSLSYEMFDVGIMFLLFVDFFSMKNGVITYMFEHEILLYFDSFVHVIKCII